ncbi:MAG: DUF971 domain-containing protein [Bdellovibrionota bacterium]
MSQNLSPSQIEPLNSTEMRIVWSGAGNDSGSFALSYIELRFACPCAHCVDEHTGQRTLVRTSIDPEIRPKGVTLVGRYAISLDWTDGHTTGIYHFDRLFELCQKQGRRLDS